MNSGAKLPAGPKPDKPCLDCAATRLPGRSYCGIHFTKRTSDARRAREAKKATGA